MPKLRCLSGGEVIKILAHFEFAIASQHGSHVKLQRTTAAGERRTLTIPNHSELDTGTCRAIYRQATRYIPDHDLRPFFYV